jgi:CheY-like chemotaxis protein/nitrogen-specific signal transduction histidine kinase
VVLVVRDVGERRREAQLREQLLERARAAHAEAQAANRAKDEFLAVLSHELRTPLQAILGWAQVLQRADVTASEMRRAGEVIERNAERQARLVEDVLDVSRIVSGKLKLASAPVVLADAIQAAIEILRPTFEAKRVSLGIDVAEACEVLGDQQRLEQVVWNLLSNAVKFTPPGGRVEVGCARAGEDVKLSVRDTGCGIHPDFLPHVFDRFRQEDAGATRRQGGLGLGLAIVRHIVEMHGGRVEAASDGPERGATFTIFLPHASVTRPVAKAADERTAAVDLAGIRVLAVDDEADARDLIEVMLGPSGARVRGAASAREALEIVEVWRPDVIVSDLSMPEADGYELLRQLRERGYQDVPVIALTAAAFDDRAPAAGFALRASKPIGQKELCEAVRQAVEGSLRR